MTFFFCPKGIITSEQRQEPTAYHSFAEAQKFGIRKERAVNYNHDHTGTQKLFAGVSAAVCCTLKASPENYHVAMDNSGWADDINADFLNRKAVK